MALANLRRFIADVKPAIVDQLKDFAAEWEQWAREHRTWQDDTGSAATALTAWVLDYEDYKKNFDKEPWLGAREGRVLSRYGNPPSNYYPVEPNMEGIKGSEDDAIVVCLSHFVHYGDTLEEEAGAGLLSEALHSHASEFVRRIESAIRDLL